MFPIRTSVRVDEIPAAVIALIVANVAVFVFQIGLPPELAQQFVNHNGLIPARYTDPGFARNMALDPLSFLPFVTSAFMHGGWWHLIVNMWTLWLFGAALESRLGALRIVGLYLMSAILANAVHVAAHLESTLPAVGASGAIAGILGAFTLLYPRERIWLLMPILFFPISYSVRAFYYTGLWFLVQAAFGITEMSAGAGNAEVGGVAWWAHIGGFLAGLVIAQTFGRRRMKTRQIGKARETVRYIGSERLGVRHMGSPVRRRSARRAEPPKNRGRRKSGLKKWHQAWSGLSRAKSSWDGGTLVENPRIMVPPEPDDGEDEILNLKPNRTVRRVRSVLPTSGASIPRG